MTEHDREHEHPLGSSSQQGHGQGTGNSFGSGQQAQGSDERLREVICERLMQEQSLDASDVEVSVQGVRVTLDGSIDSRMAKYQVEDIVDHMGVSDVQNNLRVSRDEQTPGHGSEPSSQAGSSGGVSSLGISGSGIAGVDRTATGGTNSDDPRSSSPQ